MGALAESGEEGWGTCRIRRTGMGYMLGQENRDGVHREPSKQGWGTRRFRRTGMGYMQGQANRELLQCCAFAIVHDEVKLVSSRLPMGPSALTSSFCRIDRALNTDPWCILNTLMLFSGISVEPGTRMHSVAAESQSLHGIPTPLVY